MELPQRQSQILPPQATSLAPANPAIVGGGAVTQGLNAAASGMLVLANYELQQQQAEDVAQAGLMVGDLSRKLLEKEQELADRRANDPTLNPRDLNREFIAAAKQLEQEFVHSPVLANHPRLRKFAIPHIETSVNNHLSHYQQKSNEDWKPWYHLKGTSTVDGLVQTAAQTGSLVEQDTLMTRAHETINGMVLLRSITPEQGDAWWGKIKSEVAALRSQRAIGADPNSYLNAVKSGGTDDWFLQHGVNPVSVDAKQRADLFTSAETSMKLNAYTEEQTKKSADLVQKKRHEQTERQVVAQVLANYDSPDSPALSYHEIQQLVENDSLSGTQGEKIITLLRTLTQDRKVHGDEAANASFAERIARPFTDPRRLTDSREVIDAAAAGRLSVEHMRQLIEDIETSRTVPGADLIHRREEFLKGFKTSITRSNPLTGAAYPAEDNQYRQFEALVRSEIQKAIRDKRDPLALFDDASPDFLGRQVPKFQKTITQSTQAITESVAPTRQPTPPLPSEQMRKPGETIDAYMNRQSGKAASSSVPQYLKRPE